ncbi:MAG: hypothetical protein ACP5KX_07560 [Caldisericia bacterium]
MYGKGFTTIEMLINFIIYTIITVIFLGLSIMPLQNLILNSYLRKIALIYYQIGHLDNPIDIYKAREYTFDFINLNKDDIKIDEKLKDIIKNYIDNTYPYDTFLAKLFNINEFEFKIDEGESSLYQKIKDQFLPKRIKISVSYPVNLFNIFNFGAYFKNSYIGLKYNKIVYIYINK